MVARVRMNGLFSALLWILYISGNTEFIAKPIDTEVRIGDSTFLNCSISDVLGKVSWYHYPVDERNVLERFVYSKGHVLKPYNERFKIDRESSTGSFNLVITQAEHQDAGMYVCQEEKTDISTRAELIVLESNPSCSSNNLEGFIGPNDCGLKQDIIQLSCSIKYKGNVVPQLHITRTKEKHYFHANESKLSCSLSKEIGQITCNYNEMADSDLDGSYFICHTKRSRNTQYNCSTEVIKIHYANGQKSLLARTVGDSVTCSAKTSSHDCVYSWIWIDDSHKETISQSNRLTIKRAGLHQCKANCKIRASKCNFDAMMVMASTSTAVPVDDSKRFTSIIVGCLGIGLLISIFVNAAMLYCRNKRKFEGKPQPRLWLQGQNFDSEELHPLLPGTPVKMSNKFINENLSYTTKFEYIKDIPTRASSVISGLTILMKKLYILHEYNSTVEVYDLNTFNHERNFIINRPSTVKATFDIASLESNKCLYLAYLTEGHLLCQIGVLDIFGKVSHHWSIDDSECRLTMYESNVIVCTTNKNQIAEYSENGDEVVTMTLPLDSGFHKLWHAIKIADSKYAVSYTVTESQEHRVSIVEREASDNGEMLVNIVYSTSPQMCGMNMPIDLVKFGIENILVADKLNNRVLLIDILDNSYKVPIRDGRIKNIKSNCCLEHHPVRMCLDENNGRLFVALSGSYLKVGAISVFRVGLQDNRDSAPVIVAESVSYKKELERIKETTTRADKVISGMTLFNKTVYVAYEHLSTLEAYDYHTMTFDPERSVFMKDFLTNPMDIASSESSKCLYVVDLPNRESQCRIKTLSTDGNIPNHWFVDDNECRLSVYESNVIVCLHNTNQIIEYSSEGEVVFRVKLSPGIGFDKLWHAIKVSGTQYAVSHTVPQSKGHRVSIIESDDNVEVRGNNPRSVRIVYSTSPKSFGMNTPICLAKDRWGRILVAELLNNRVLLIDTASDTCEVILRDGRIKNIPTECKCKIEHHPLRLCLDESSEKLIVAMGGSYLKAGVICTFKVQDTQSA